MINESVGNSEMEKGIRRFLEEHSKINPVSFHMPGHKGKKFYERMGYGRVIEDFANCDITEIPGADNLFKAEDVILQTMKKYESLYGVKKSYLLVNGSSAGIIAAVLATVPKGGKLIMARNCHKSVFNALSLGDIEPIYAFPQAEKDYAILGKVTAEEIVRCLDENPDASAVILPSPNYYGICSDIESISREVHRRGKILIVDQAHGAHLKFFDEDWCPGAAENLGADVVINSTHKTLGSFTQTAVMNICTDRVDLNVIEDKLQTIESSSPSYPLMMTLDINADIMLEKGAELVFDWKENLKWFYEEASKIDGLVLMNTKQLDRTKLNIDMFAYGFDGNMLESFLMERNIFVELVSGNMVMCMTGIGNTRSDYERLIEALRELSESYSMINEVRQKPMAVLTKKLEKRSVPKAREAVSLDKACGRVCAMSIVPYPPGIPIACPGEVLDDEVLSYIRSLRNTGEKVIGVSKDMEVWVGKE